MNFAVAIYSAILFFILSPGVLLRLPPNGSKMTVAAVHAVVFGIVLYFTASTVWRFSMSMSMHPASRMHKEGMHEPTNKPHASH